MRLEEIQSLSIEADDLAATATGNLRRLTSDLERLGAALEPGDFAARKAAIEQAEMRAANANAKALDLRNQVDALRSVEDTKMRRDQAQRNYERLLSEFRMVETEIETKLRALSELRSSIPFAQQRRSLLLDQLDRAKTALQQMEVSA